MPSRHLTRSPSPRLDFTRRAQLSEWMDQPCSYQEFQACLHDLASVNRLTFAYRPTRVWLERLVRRLGSHLRARQAPLHIVDVGSGQGDMLRYLGRWAKQAGLRVRLTGLDLNPYAARAAGAIPSPTIPVDWVTGDAFSFAPPNGIDVVISSLFTHHLPDAEVVRFLAWMEAKAQYGWFINDLYRGPAPYRLFRLLAWAARWHPFVRHDGPVSIQRSFRPDDWRRYLASAQMPQDAATIEHFWPARLCVSRIRI